MVPTPDLLGLEKYTTWWSGQEEVCRSILESNKRFVVQVCPTGFGKSLIYMLSAYLTPGRTVVLTSTKGLQDQLIRDFGSLPGVVEMRGRSNYPCRLNTKVTCDSAQCIMSSCLLQSEGGCFYFDQLKRAKSAKIVITNYAYWMAQNEYSEGLGKFSMLVMDEGHSSPNHVLNHVGVRLSRKGNSLLNLNEIPNDHIGWRLWASNYLDEVSILKVKAKIDGNHLLYKKLNNLESKLQRIQTMGTDWVWEEDKRGVTLTPTSPARYAEGSLFLGIPKVVVTSATVSRKTMEMLGVPRNKMDYGEHPHPFPVENRRLIHVPTVHMNYRNGPYEERVWLNRMDNIIRDRLDSKGIIHTISYGRRNLVMKGSRWSDFMITHDRRDTAEVVMEFKKASPPCILVSPSISTGWDFPYDECRWQIIIKLPYPDTTGRIVKEMAARDKQYIPYVTIQQLEQATGRGSRAADDWCETFILDNNVVWFLNENKRMVHQWFMDAFSVSRIIPKWRGGEREDQDE